MAGQVRFLGRVRHPDLVQLFNESLACVLSSRSEGFPRVLLESLACGTPVIATRVGGCADLIGDAGVLVPAGDVSALAEAMIAMLASPDRQRRLADVCRARSALFDHDTRAEAFRELFSSLVDRQPA